MNNKIKNLTLILATMGLVACNSGGGSGGNPNPEPTPSPTPTVEVQPLTITQNIIPSLNKVAGHKIWYMVVKNPNTIPVYMYRLSSGEQSFAYDPANTSPINPTKYAMAYDGAISGVTQDCLNYITNEFYFPSGASCAFKFEAQWGINTNSQTNFNMEYSFITGTNPNDPNDTRSNQYYTLKQGCVANQQYKNYCLSNNQNLQVNVMQVTQTANDLAFGGDNVNSFHIGSLSAGNRSNYDGSTIWNPQNNNTYVYSVNYNSSNNTYNRILINTYNEFLYFNGSAISLNGNNFYGNVYNQNGLMSNVQSVDANLQWTTGLDNNVYGSNGSTGNIYLLNQSNNMAATRTKYTKENKQRHKTLVEYNAELVAESKTKAAELDKVSNELNTEKNNLNTTKEIIVDYMDKKKAD